MYFGTNSIEAAYFGEYEVQKAYFGTNLVYEKGGSTDPDITLLTNKIYSGFSDSNYITCDNFLNDTQDSFEVKAKISLSANSTSNCSIIDTKQENSTTAFRFEINSSNKLQARFSNTVGDFQYFLTLTGNTSLQIGTWYYVKVTYNSTSGYALYLTEDKTDWGTAEATSSITTKIGTTLTTLLIGDNAVAGSSFPGSIDLSELEFNVNGNTVFNGATAVAGTDYTIVGTFTTINVTNISEIGLTTGVIGAVQTKVYEATDYELNNPDAIGLTTGVIGATVEDLSL